MSASHQLPSSLVAKEFGEVNVRPAGDRLEVNFTVAMEPQGVESEGWQTGVALDASASMREWFGQVLKGELPDNVMAQYKRKGWITERFEDGQTLQMVRPEAYEDAIKRGYLRFSDNIVEPLARDFIAYLAERLDADGGTTVIYWACGDGSATEVLGDFPAAECRRLELKGPREVSFGAGTRLRPALKYFVERFADAERGMYLFITDGRLDDLEDVKAFTRRLAKEIEAGRRKPVKCVLLGVGEEVDEGQMEELDDLDTGTDVDLWDHKLAAEMRMLQEIFAEVVDQNARVSDHGRILDPTGRVVKNYSDTGLPAFLDFEMPAGADYFTLDVNGSKIHQGLSDDAHVPPSQLNR